MRALPFKLSKLAAAIGGVLWCMAFAPHTLAPGSKFSTLQNSPDGGPDYPDGHDSEGFPGGSERMRDAQEKAPAFAVDFGTDPEAAPMTAEAAVRYAKPKRVRVRAKPLTVADIAAGAWYVPKRGNDKTPNLFVAAIDDADVLYDRRRPDALSVGEVTRVSMADFLALVARRADA